MSAPLAAAEIKEVSMDVATAPMEGGAKTRRRGGRRRARTQKAVDTQEGGAYEMTVEKAHDAPAVQHHQQAVVPPKVAAPALAPSAPIPQAGGAKPPVVVIAPAKKKPAKVMFVPKEKKAAVPGHSRVIPKKTFKAKRVRVVIDNTAKTQKHRTQVLGRIDAMSEDQLRGAAVSARLSRRETVAKVPIDLLRQMLKDYQSMRGNML
jgi:hypothetical protein